MFYSEITKIIEAGLERDKEKVKNCALLESKKFYITKKPGNPNRFLTDPDAPELFELYAISAVFS